MIEKEVEKRDSRKRETEKKNGRKNEIKIKPLVLNEVIVILYGSMVIQKTDYGFCKILLSKFPREVRSSIWAILTTGV